jgi:phage-related minor tail protein
VQEAQDRGAGELRGGVDVAGKAAGPGVEQEAVTRLGQGAQELARAIGTAVVDQDHLAGEAAGGAFQAFQAGTGEIQPVGERDENRKIHGGG